MDHPRIVELVKRACAAAHADGPSLEDAEGEVPVARYTDPRRLERERAMFRRLPIPIAHASELTPGRALVRDLCGVSLLVSGAGVLRNSCRHRGVRLLEADGDAKAFVCPYHGWTYDLAGRRIHSPHACAFAPSLVEGRDLVAVASEVRHGIVWASLEGAPSVADHLGPIDEEIATLCLDRHVIGSQVTRVQRGNWKFLVEAFLDGYHIRTLHRSTVYPFFLDARSAAERAGIHIRSASARRAAKEPDVETKPLRERATFNFNVFPATTIIAHPDWTSLVTVQPVATDRFLYSHLQLLPEAPTSEKAAAHFARSFALIEGEVFAKEDLRMCEEAQNGLETGANTSFVFGRLESPALWFHAALADALGE